MFSATGNILSGSSRRPDVVTFYVPGEKRVGEKGLESHTLHRLDNWGRKPLLSTLSGPIRAFLGIVHAVIHLACAFFSCLLLRKESAIYHFQEVGLGCRNAARGAAETLPLLGNLIALVLDNLKVKKYEDQSSRAVYGQILRKDSAGQTTVERIDSERSVVQELGSAKMFINGKEEGKIAPAQYDKTLPLSKKIALFVPELPKELPESKG